MAGMRIVGTVVAQPSTKVYIQHFRRRKNYRRLKGHRQHYVEVKVTNILEQGQEVPPLPPAPPRLRQPPRHGEIHHARRPRVIRR